MKIRPRQQFLEPRRDDLGAVHARARAPPREGTPTSASSTPPSAAARSEPPARAESPASPRRCRRRACATRAGGTYFAATSGSISSRSSASGEISESFRAGQVDLACSRSRAAGNRPRAAPPGPAASVTPARRARRPSRSWNSRLVNGLRGFAEEGAEHGHGRWRDARNARRLTERLGADLRETVDDFARQPGNALERESRPESDAVPAAASARRAPPPAAGSRRT